MLSSNDVEHHRHGSERGIRADSDALAGGTDARLQREFRRARRHSRFVSALKFGLPVIAVLIVAGGVGATWIARSLPADVSAAAVGLSDGRLVMEDPRMSGFDKQNRPYTMIAQRAVQSLGGGSIDLENVRASIPMDDDTTAEVVAASGFYRPDEDKLRLFGNIKVRTSDGMTVQLGEAEIDIAGGRLIGKGPVRIDMPGQEIEAGSMTVGQSGKAVGFAGRVKMKLLPENERNIAQRISGANDL